ncbi:heme NO-binding domain-containing protein [Nisaea acidiphila]|uniref:Heme NO-binding domain-containing protein n=1 Tax=Nisaea acidiphila TaxID=1862145 RepID=A0A9J7ART6_9PROT|nr:heme NO-binding domain-containing protein [Nisaea acidiphila]UUX50072.1 heme NO-binding domain-containing protein [Nisaea acidiphila]
MKGEIFVAFVDLVENEFGLEVADAVLSHPSLASGGSYSRTGTYPHSEMVTLVVALTERTGASASALQRTFGQFLFSDLMRSHTRHAEAFKDCFSLIQAIHGTIHNHVRVLYPDASLPTISVTTEGADVLTVKYSSERGFAHVCHGLIEGCIDHFGESISIEAALPGDEPLINEASFRLTRSN